MKNANVRRMTFAASTALILGALGSVPLTASASPPTPPTNGTGHTLSSNTVFYVPPAAKGSAEEVAQLIAHGDRPDAGLIRDMEATPQAVWFNGGTAQQVKQQVRQTLHMASLQDAVPILVAYNLPGRDCSQYSAGGAPSDVAYQSWISAFAQGIGSGEAVVILEPDSLANLPSDCSSAYQTANPGITDATREADVAYAVNALEVDPNVSVYLDGGHSAWQAVGNIAGPLVAAGVAKAQGFFLDVSNYQYATNNVFYGTWVSDCIALGKGSLTYNYAGCPNQYWNGGGPTTSIGEQFGQYNGVAMSPYGVWSETSTVQDLNTSGIDASFQGLLAGTVPTTHFVIDTSRDGQGPNDMEAYYAAPYDQPQSVVGSTPGVTYPDNSPPGGSLQNGNWCNPPSSGTGILPTANTSTIPNSLDSYLPAKTSLLDAYLWVKTPGQSDGQCDLAGGVRNWQDGPPVGGYGYTPPITGWPASTAAAFKTFDPLWSLQTNSVFTDPAAGAWFAPEALQLAQLANPTASPGH